MKKLSLIVIVLIYSILLSNNSYSQDKKARLSLKASVSQTIGINTEIKIDYSRPGVKGRKIWGDLVPFGLAPGNKYSKDNPYPWRAGANENTTIEFSKDVSVEGKLLKAGKYGIHMIPQKKEWTIILSKKNDAWGSYSYSKEYDALRITVKPLKSVHQEWLTYGFENLSGNSATVYLNWEKLKIPFNVKVVK